MGKIYKLVQAGSYAITCANICKLTTHIGRFQYKILGSIYLVATYFAVALLVDMCVHVTS